MLKYLETDGMLGFVFRPTLYGLFLEPQKSRSPSCGVNSSCRQEHRIDRPENAIKRVAVAILNNFILSAILIYYKNSALRLNCVAQVLSQK